MHSSAIKSAYQSSKRFILYVLNHFIEDDCAYRASALTFTSLLALLPLMVVGLGILSAFPVFKSLAPLVQTFIFEHFVPTTGKVVQAYLMTFTTQVQRLSVFGIGFLFITAILMMYTIERAMNQIWRVNRARRGVTALLLYWSILSLTPILLGLSLGATSYILSLPIIKAHEANPYFLHLLPVLFSWLGFSFLFIVVPNCRVRFKDGLRGALCSAILFESAKYAFALYLRHYSSYELLYGALATIPILFVWIYWVWIVTLLGAEICHALSAQHERRQGEALDGFNHAVLWLYHLWIAQQNGASVSKQALIDTSPSPYKIKVGVMLEILTQAHLIMPTRKEQFLLSRDLSNITLYELYQMLPFPLKSLHEPLIKDNQALQHWHNPIAEADNALRLAMDTSLENIFSTRPTTPPL